MKSYSVKYKKEGSSSISSTTVYADSPSHACEIVKHRVIDKEIKIRYTTK